MVEENLMKTIIKTFVDHLRHRDLHGCFQFDRYTAQQAFKFGRVQSLIGDLKWEAAHRSLLFHLLLQLHSKNMCDVPRYVLISRPSDWTDQLRFKFLEGLDAFLELLKCMQVYRRRAYLHRQMGRVWVHPAHRCVCLSGDGPSVETGRTAHRNGTWVGGSVHSADEAH